MLRLYHKLRALYSAPQKHKKTTIIAGSLLVLLLWLSPFYKHAEQIADIARSFLFGKITDLKSDKQRTDFVFLGLGGPKNEPSSLTDSQQFFSYDHNKKRHILLSIPRDIWLPEFGIKINSAYSYGNITEGTGIDLTKKYISQITGQPVHYSVMISFDGFVKLIDALGGIDLEVVNSFTDPQYPVRGREEDTCGGDQTLKCRWETITFEKGRHRFDGQTALKFVRSRHARGDEGTDFARASRQQKVMLAIKKKVISPAVLLNPSKLSQLLGLGGEVFETDIPQKDLGLVARVLLEARAGNIRAENLPAIDPGNIDENLDKAALLIHPPVSEVYKNQWVLVPVGGTWEPTHNYINCLFENDDCPVSRFALDWKISKK